MDYIMPFLIVLCAGVVFVLVFSLFKAFFSAENPRAAYVHIVSGNAEMRTWGTESFFRLSSDTLIMQGDEIRSSADARLIVEFFDGTIMRMGDDTVVEFVSIVDEGKSPSIDLHLKRGDVWFNKLYRDTKGTSVSITLNDIVVRSNDASVFAVDNKTAQIVRVFGVFGNDGLLVDILREDGKKVVETEKIGIGQEIVFDDKVLDRYWKHQSPTVISAISDLFKSTSWCEWNFGEDKDPTYFEKIVDGVDVFNFIKVEPEMISLSVEDLEDEIRGESPSEVIFDGLIEGGAVEKPKLTSVAGITEKGEDGFYRVSSRVATLKGTVSGASKVIVNDYVLQQFNPEDTTWTYFANADYDLMREGENTYEVYAEGAEGSRSDPLIIKVFYDPKPVTPPVEQEDPEDEEE